MIVSLFIYHCSGRSAKTHETGASLRYKETATDEAVMIFAFSFVYSLYFYTYICSLLYKCLLFRHLKRVFCICG